MTTASKNIFFAAGSLLIILSLIGWFNYQLDPMCYRCESIDLNHKTQNVYYRSAQTAAANPDAQVLIVGSSRGERVPPQWVSAVTGLKSINLSQGGADVLLKAALVNIALKTNTQVKKVIWMADYFELVPRMTDYKVPLTPVLQKYSGAVELGVQKTPWMQKLQGFIDHRTFEAGLEMYGKSAAETFNKAGNGEEIDYKKCLSDDFVGSTTSEELSKKIDESYSIFGILLGDEQNPLYWDLFEKEIRLLSSKGIEVVINVAPYHPKLLARSFREVSLAERHQSQWVRRMQKLTGPLVKVLTYERGIPGDDGSPRYWEDGAHPTCYSVIQMLKPALQRE